MKYGNLILEKKEYVYIKSILNISGYVGNHVIHKSLMKFSDEMKSAKIVEDKDMPEDVVRLNSIVKVSSDDNWEKSIQIVQPSEKDIQNNKISILTPMGAALFGYSVGDVVNWDFPTGVKALKIEEVEQKPQVKAFSV
ncbi:GreA/GreB family elongation factor [Mariniflexile ostreae]|uniref:GreA/GreB family elongation factor n=1 Tax=Mariniflexile ostreae TaxID=1520892 RepID=A0ABV5FFN5_9FLAO